MRWSSTRLSEANRAISDPAPDQGFFAQPLSFRQRRVVLTARFSNLACQNNNLHFTRSEAISEADEPHVGKTNRPQKQQQRRLTPNETDQLIAQYVRGATVSQLARKWKIHRTTVMDHLKRHHVPTKAHRRKLTDTDVTKASELYRAGDSLAKLGQWFGVDGKTIARELKAIGITMRPPGRWG